MMKHKTLAIVIISFSSLIFAISCVKSEIKNDPFQLTPKELFLKKIMDLGNLIGQHEKVLTNIYGSGDAIDTARIKDTLEVDKNVKCIQVKLLKEKEILWYVNDILDEIHIEINKNKVFDTFSGSTTEEQVIEFLGQPKLKYGSNDSPPLENLMYNSSRFSLHFIFSWFDLDEKINAIQIFNKKEDPTLKEIRMTYPYEKPVFISVLENEIYHSNKIHN